MNRKQLIRALVYVVALAPGAGLIGSGHMGWGYVAAALWFFVAVLAVGWMYRDDGAKVLTGEDRGSDFLQTVWLAFSVLVVVVLSAIEAPDRGWIPVIGFGAGALWCGLFFLSRGFLRFPGFHGPQPGGLVLASEAPPLHPRELAITITLNRRPGGLCAHELLVGTVVKAFESPMAMHHCWCCGRTLPTSEGVWRVPEPSPTSKAPEAWFCADCPAETS